MNGMMSNQQEMPMPEPSMGGMLSNQQEVPQEQGAEGSYNGVVDYGTGKVLVRNGMAEIDGKNFKVFGDGDMIVDEDANIVGYIVDGTYQPMDAEQLNKLVEMGMAKRS